MAKDIKFKQKRIFEAPEDFSKRNVHEDIHTYRSNFQRDRDRILYSKPFRRLNGKTQVFLPHAHDHLRDRMTHTLEVSQIARVTAKNLGLNAELTEAIALAHDLGHTPFGHVGENSLNFIMNECEELYKKNILKDKDKGFKHNWQSVRICCDLNKIYPNIRGLNITNFTLLGILIHSSTSWNKTCSCFDEGKCYLNSTSQECSCFGSLSTSFYEPYKRYLYANNNNGYAWSFEGEVVGISDEIAQRHHDIEDAYIMDILKRKDIIDIIETYFNKLLKKEDRENLNKANNNEAYFVSLISKFLVHLYNRNLIDYSKKQLTNLANEYNIKNKRDFKIFYQDIDTNTIEKCIDFNPEFKEAENNFKEFLKNTILNSSWVQRMDGKGLYVIRKIFQAYLTNPKQLHDNTILSTFNNYNNTNLDINMISKPDLGKYRNKIGSPEYKKCETFQIALLRSICDHISGMTDNFILSEYTRLYGEKSL